MPDRVDFSANAPLYDRRHGAVLSPDVARQLAFWSALAPNARVLDIGAGTGRVAIAFARLGYATLAADPSTAMLAELRRKAPEDRIHAIAGEGALLPLAPASVDVVVLARVLYLISDWQAVLRQARDVLKPHGCLLHEWGSGQPGELWVEIREKARELFQQAGVANPFHPGARTEEEADHHLAALGFIRTIDLPLGPGPEMTLRAFLAAIASGELSYIWNVPESVRQTCLPRLEEWCAATFDLDQSIPIPEELRWTIYRKP